MLNKLTSDHINLTPFSVTRVRLAAQVLSETVGTVLNSFGPAMLWELQMLSNDG